MELSRYRDCFKKKSSKGFDITVGFDREYFYLATDRGYHFHYEAPAKFIKTTSEFDEVLADVMGGVRDLLSRNERIREVMSNNKPRKWILEHLVNGEWKQEAVTGLLFWNYLGKRNRENV